MYKVIKAFYDLLDKNHPYEVGDTFPRKDCGYTVSEARFAELAGNGNKQGAPLIELADDKQDDKQDDKPKGKGKGKGKNADAEDGDK